MRHGNSPIRRLEGIFGGPLGALTADQVESLVPGQAQESFDLEFKGRLYGRSDQEKRDLAGDVAALANTAGGVIVIGIEEDDQARAESAPGVEISDAEVARVWQVVASGVAPMPTFDVLTVLRDGSNGFIVVAVPRSPQAPHAVPVNNGLRYPRRNGSTTWYLSEPEVADAYRNPMLAATQRLARIEEMENEATKRLNRSQDAWLVVSLQPDVPGECDISTTTFNEFRDEILQVTALPIHNNMRFQTASVGHRRFLADSIRDDTADTVDYLSIELCADGAGVMAVRLFDLGFHDAAGRETPPRQRISDEYLASGIIGALELLAGHARDRAATSGLALARARIVPAVGVAQTYLGHDRGGYGGRVINKWVSGPSRLASSYVDIDDVGTASPLLVAAAARLHRELGQIFGWVELHQLTREGAFYLPYWAQDVHQSLRQWADANGIPVEGG